MDLQQLLSGGGGASSMLGGGMAAAPGRDMPQMDTAETIQISSVALMKMLKHGRAGVPLEVMGLMLGEFVDDYCVKVVDVFAMPQSGTGVSVEAVDPVFQTKMLDMLKQTGRPEMVVGWYHSHPGFGPWLSSVDVNTQMSFEALNKRAVAVVIDPIQSVKGKVVIDAFRTISPQTMMMQMEPRQTTSNVGHLHKPSIVALIHGLNRHYYSMPIDCRRGSQMERQLLRSVNFNGGVPSSSSIKSAAAATSFVSTSSASSTVNGAHSHQKQKKKPTDDNATDQLDDQQESTAINQLTKLARLYSDSIKDEVKLSAEELKNRHVGRQDPKRHLKEQTERTIISNVDNLLRSMISRQVF